MPSLKIGEEAVAALARRFLGYGEANQRGFRKTALFKKVLYEWGVALLRPTSDWLVDRLNAAVALSARHSLNSESRQAHPSLSWPKYRFRYFDPSLP